MRKYFLLMCVAFSLFGLEEEELNWEDDRTFSAQEFHSYLQQSIQDQQWWAVIDYADILSYHFPTSPFAQDASFIMGEAYFHLAQYELANECFSAYLNHSNSPRHFEKT